MTVTSVSRVVRGPSPVGRPLADVELADRRRHRVSARVARSASIARAASISRSLPARSRIVRRRQWASGWPAPNVRGTRPRRSSPVAVAAARSARPEVDQEEVRDRRPDAPAGLAQRACEPVPLRVDAGDVRGHGPRIRERRGHHASTLTVDTEPGGRYGAIRAIVPGWADREADPQPGQRIRLARRSDDDQVRVIAPQAQQRRADELRVRLVQDDDRPARAGGIRVGGDAGEQRLDRAVRLGQPRRVVRAAQPDQVRVRRRRSPLPRGRARSPRPARDAARATARGAALLGHDAVHRVGRGRHDRSRHRPAGTPCRQGPGSRPRPAPTRSSSVPTP